MAMRIVSQDKTHSYNFNEIVVWVQQNVLYARIGIHSEVIGAYKDPERAIAVMEELHNQYMAGNCIYEMPRE